MKTGRLRAIIIALAAAAVAAAAVCLFPKNAKADGNSAVTRGLYDYTLENYSVTYDIAQDCGIRVEEILEIRYEGTGSTGIKRDIPVNGGTIVKDIKVEGIKLINGETVPYDVYVEDGSFVTVDIGSRELKYGKSETYRVTYLYCIENGMVRDGLLPLNPVGGGWDCVIENARVTLILPAGFLSAKRYEGVAGSSRYDLNFTLENSGGAQVITTSAQNLGYGKGITFDLTFEKGALRPYADNTPYIYTAVAAGILLAVVLVKLLFFNKTRLTPVVNFEAPEGMDPLKMGKLIDNKVNPEDVTALIFYWADKGYLKISLSDGDPVLIRIKNLPPEAENYERIVFSGLFKQGDMVKTSSLQNNFYTVYRRAATAADGRTKGLYASTSIGVSIIFALAAGILAGIACLVNALTAVSDKFVYLYGFAALIPALALYAVCETAAYNRLKNSKGKNVLSVVLIVAGIALCTFLADLFIPDSVMPAVPKIIMLAVCYCTVALSVIIISRTANYNSKLNEIVGFRNFILLAEKDRLEKLIESDPQYYYHVLPYAQVLNVSDAWKDKFAALTVPPPEWAVRSATDAVFDFIIINSLIKNSAIALTRGLVSRPSSTGVNGFGGNFGGFSGGGFGGGGGRGR